MNFADRLLEAQRRKDTIAVLGVDPQLDNDREGGLPAGYTLERFCCEIVEACAASVAAIKPQLAFFEARGIEGMRAFAAVVKLARDLDLLTIADAKRGDIGNTSDAYAQAFLGDGEFACDAMTINPYLGSDAIMPFVRAAPRGRGLFVLVKTSNPTSGEFQDLATADGPVWENVARRINGLGSDFLGESGMSAIGAVVGATYPEHARRARELMPNAVILVPGYGAQGAGAADAVAAARPDGSGLVVNASRSIVYAYRKRAGIAPAVPASEAAEAMRKELNGALTDLRSGTH
ncbi:MAG TPA: orotidine-5'-phosphate decarboxylase [Candidatus Binataceae bacterium]|nr:orotidine-5'-phosphate decarboxylase [Candidatus Binataceae bacterium]